VVTAANLPIVEFQLIMPNPLAILLRMRLIRMASYYPYAPSTVQFRQRPAMPRRSRVFRMLVCFLLVA